MAARRPLALPVRRATVTINPDGTGRTTHGARPDEAVLYDADLSPDGTTFAGPWGEGEVSVWNWTTGATAHYTNDGGRASG